MKKYLFFILVITLFSIACSKKREDTKSVAAPSVDSFKSVPTPAVESPQEDTMMIAPMDKTTEESQLRRGPVMGPSEVMGTPTSDDATPVKKVDIPAAGGKPKTDVLRSLPAPGATPPIEEPSHTQPHKKAVGFHQMDEEEPTQE